MKQAERDLSRVLHIQRNLAISRRLFSDISLHVAMPRYVMKIRRISIINIRMQSWRMRRIGQTKANCEKPLQNTESCILLLLHWIQVDSLVNVTFHASISGHFASRRGSRWDAGHLSRKSGRSAKIGTGGNPLGGKNLGFSTEIAVYLGNGTG